MSRRDVADRREQLERPFAGEHATSVARRTAQPKGLGGLLVWFLTGFRAEMPDAVHAAGVWRDYVRLDEDRRRGRQPARVAASRGSVPGADRGQPVRDRAVRVRGPREPRGRRALPDPDARGDRPPERSPPVRPARAEAIADHVCPETLDARSPGLPDRLPRRRLGVAGLDFVQPSLVRSSSARRSSGCGGRTTSSRRRDFTMEGLPIAV
jgi:hypothetical protein